MQKGALKSGSGRLPGKSVWPTGTWGDLATQEKNSYKKGGPKAAFSPKVGMGSLLPDEINICKSVEYLNDPRREAIPA